MNRNKKVLVVTDRQEQYDLTTTLLRKDGYTILFENDMGSSLKLAEVELPNLVISELAVPNIDGLELSICFREDTTLESIPLLLVGDLSKQSSIVADGLRCGAVNYLQKPINHLELFDLCRGLADFEGPGETINLDESRVNAKIETISDVITFINGDGSILFESPSVELVLGYDPNELLGKNIFDFVHPAEVGAVIEHFNPAHWYGSVTRPLKYRFRRKDGYWKVIESTGSFFGDVRFGSTVIVTSHEIFGETICSRQCA